MIYRCENINGNVRTLTTFDRVNIARFKASLGISAILHFSTIKESGGSDDTVNSV